MARSGPAETQDRILDVAEHLLQTRGFNGFSYADISDRLAIRKASIHYYFPTKADLGRTLIERYHRAFQQELNRIEQKTANAPGRLKAYVKLYDDVLRDKNRVCLCGMLAADFTTLSKAIRNRVAAFFEDNESWLVRVLEEGRKARTVRFTGPAEVAARLVLASLEGAMLVARSYGDVRRFESVAEKLLGDFEVPSKPKSRKNKQPNSRQPEASPQDVAAMRRA